MCLRQVFFGGLHFHILFTVTTLFIGTVPRQPRACQDYGRVGVADTRSSPEVETHIQPNALPRGRVTSWLGHQPSRGSADRSHSREPASPAHTAAQWPVTFEHAAKRRQDKCTHASQCVPSKRALSPDHSCQGCPGNCSRIRHGCYRMCQGAKRILGPWKRCTEYWEWGYVTTCGAENDPAQRAKQARKDMRTRARNRQSRWWDFSCDAYIG